MIEPLRQIVLGRWNPVLDEWQTRFRGFIQDYDYSFDPSQQINRLTLTLVDIFEILNAIKMQPTDPVTFGDDPSFAVPDASGNIFFLNGPAGGTGRIEQVMYNAGVDPAFYVAFEFNVNLHDAVYAGGESPLAVIQDCADAEFPNANVYTDRFGRLCAHGRYAKLDPATTASGAGNEQWDWHHWDCGDGAAVAVSPTTVAQIRRFAFNRGLAQVINQATATPLRGYTNPLTAAELIGQVVSDSDSIGQYGIRSWTAQNLLTKEGIADSSTDLEETYKFARWIVDTRKEPRNRVTDLAFRSMRPGAPGGAITWKLLCEADIADQIDITVASPGGGGFLDAPFFIEGIHEESRPLNGDYDDVTMSLDVSPQDYNSDPEERFPPLS